MALAALSADSELAIRPPAPPIRVLRIVTRLNIGGPSRHVGVLVNGLPGARFQTHLVIGVPDPDEGEWNDPARSAHAVTRLGALRRSIRPWRDLTAFVALLRVMWQVRPQIIHTHMAKAGALGRAAGLLYNAVGPGRASAARARLVHTFHGHGLEGYFPAWGAGIFARIERQLARATDRLIAVSQSVRDELLALGIGRPDQWAVIPLGLDLDAYGALPWPEEQSSCRIGMVGRLVPIKNPSLLLQALQRARAHEPARRITALMVGDGPLRPALEEEVRRRGLEGAVTFCGWQQDVLSAYRQMDVVCLTSWNEGTPVALIEAMAAGRAVVATKVGGVADVLHDQAAPPDGGYHLGARGLMVRAGDAEGLAQALQRLAEDSALRRRLGEAARAHARAAYAKERLLNDMTSLYETLEQGRGI